MRHIHTVLLLVPFSLVSQSACLPGIGEPKADAGPAKDASGAVLANVTQEALSNECPAGGVDIELGVDRNADGTLSADEVSRVVTVCNGSAGSLALADIQRIESGDACPSGGLSVRTGVDQNGNSILDDEEVLRSEQLCDGAAGADGLTSLVKIVEVESSEVCPTGGVQVSAGLDANGDGDLSIGETTQSVVLCKGNNGEDGFSMLSITDSEAGNACDEYGNGGQRIRSGLDNGDGDGVARDGVLQEGEVDTTTYVCNGATGAQGPQGDAGPRGLQGDAGPQGPAGADGYTTLFITDGEVRNACDENGNGGSRIRSGLDNGDGGGTARNGQLEDGEVDSTTYVCNGADGANGANGTDGSDGADGFTTLTATDTEVGASCDGFGNSGQRIRSGLDNGDGEGTAHNGQLEDGEVDSTTYVCNGADGANGANGTDGSDGADGFTTLMVTDTEVGASCDGFGNSGQRIRSGLDNGDGGGTARNGELEDGEVDSMTYICNVASAPGTTCGVFHGFLAVQNDEDVRALAGCHTLVGRLEFHSPVALELSALSGLTRIDGDLYLRGAMVDNPLPNLEAVTGSVEIFDIQTPSSFVQLPKLETVDTLRLREIYLIDEVKLPLLARSSALFLGADGYENASLSNLDVPLLTELGDLYVGRNPLLSRCFIEVLANRNQLSPTYDWESACAENDGWGGNCLYDDGGDADSDGLCAPVDICPFDATANTRDVNGDCPCDGDAHNGGDTRCVATDTCSHGYLLDVDGRCGTSCSAGYHDGKGGKCLPLGECAPGYHDGGSGGCVSAGTCSNGYDLNATGECEAPTVGSNRPVLELVAPPASLSDSDDTNANLSGVQTSLNLTYTNLEAGQRIEFLRVDNDGIPTGIALGSVTTTEDSQDGNARTTAMPVHLFRCMAVDECNFALRATNVSGNQGVSALLPLTVDTARKTCEPIITTPANGTIFAASDGDADAFTEGFQRGVLLSTGNPICASVPLRVTVSVDGQLTPFTGTTGATGTASIRVTLADGTPTLTPAADAGFGFVDGASIFLSVDRSPPIITLTSPESGVVYGPASDLDGYAGNNVKTISFAGIITGATSSNYTLTCEDDDNNRLVKQDAIVMATDGSFNDSLAELPNSECTLIVTATDGTNSIAKEQRFKLVDAEIDIVLGGDADENGYWVASEDGDLSTVDVMEIPISVTASFGSETNYTGVAVVVNKADESQVMYVDLGVMTSGEAFAGTIALPFGDEENYRADITLTEVGGTTVVGPASVEFGVDTVAPGLVWQSDNGVFELSGANDQDPTRAGFQALVYLETAGIPSGSKISIRVDGETNIQTDCTVTVANTCKQDLTLPDGEFVATATAVDAAGHVVVLSRTYRIDATPPSVSEILIAVDVVDADGNASGDNIINRVEAGDVAGSATTDVTVRFAESASIEDGQLVTLTVSPGGAHTAVVQSNTALFSGITLSEGTNELSVDAQDAYGNSVSVVGRTKTVVVDTDAPELSFVSPAADSITDSTVVFVLATSAANGQILRLERVRADSSTELIGSTTVQSGGAAFVNVPVEDGAFTVRATVSDAAGNTTTVDKTYVVDTVAPILTLALQSEAGVDADPELPGFQYVFRVTYEGLSAGAAVRIVSQLADDAANTQTQRGAAITDAQAGFLDIIATFVVNGTHLVSAQAVDAAGNEGVSNVIERLVDSGLHDVIVSTPQQSEGTYFFTATNLSGGNATVLVNVPELTTDVQVAELRIDGVAHPTASFPAAGFQQAGTTLSFEFPVAEGDEGTFEVFVNDGVKTGTTGLLNYIVDGLAPELTWAVDTPNIFGVSLDEQVTDGLQYSAKLTVTECEFGTVEVYEGTTRIGGPVAVGANSEPTTVTISISDTTEHTESIWIAKCTEPSGTQTESEFTSQVDLTPPNSPTLEVVVQDARQGRVELQFAVPGDDDTTGDPATIEVVASSAPITSENFSEIAAYPVMPLSQRVFPGIGGLIAFSDAPNGGETFTTQTIGLAFGREWFLAVRATDDAGNSTIQLAESVSLDLIASTIHHVEQDAGAGATVDDVFGSAITSGDFNGDGTLDLVVATPNEGDGCMSSLCDGMIRIFSGLSFPVTDFDTNLSSRSLTDSSVFFFGELSTAIGDFDGDGFDDLAAYGITESFSSQILIFYGTDAVDGDGALYLNPTPDKLLISGFANRIENLGDVNADGFADFGFSIQSKNEAWIALGGTRYTTPQNISAARRVKLFGAATVGAAITGLRQPLAGGAGDAVVLKYDGQLVVIPGSTDWGTSADIDLAAGVYDRLVCPGTACGLDLSAGDVNGDGAADLLATNSTTGQIFVNVGNTFNSSPTYGIRHSGGPSSDRVFRFVGDVNGDGYADIAANSYSDVDNGSGALLYFGGEYGSDGGLVDGERTEADFSFAAPSGDSSPLRLGVCGDLSGDSIDNLCIAETAYPGALTVY